MVIDILTILINSPVNPEVDSPEFLVFHILHTPVNKSLAKHREENIPLAVLHIGTIDKQ